MGRVVIRPHELRALAQRFDLMADDLDRAHRHLTGDLAAVVLNPDDQDFRPGRFRPRSSHVVKRLRHAANEIRWDATVMAQTADDGEAADSGPAVVPALGVGWAPETIIGEWSMVADQLNNVGGRVVTEPGRSPATASGATFVIEPGGLFADASRPGNGGASAAIGRLETVGRRLVAEDDPDWRHLWRRISDDVIASPGSGQETDS